jgi:penicillin-binding protein 2
MKEKQRVLLFFVILIIGFVVLFARLFWLQIVRGAYFDQLAEENSVKIEKIPAPRGVIRDRNGEILVRNRPEGREYLYHQQLAHVTGYIGEANSHQVESGRREYGDLVGKTGVEMVYDEQLRGKDGGILVETNSQGEVIREIGREEPRPGADLELNIDWGLQQQVYQSLEGKTGAVVVSSPKGEILALASYPSFDPNTFTLKQKEQQQKIQTVLQNPEMPLFNRVIGGLYPPGSTFKIVSSIAGLEEGEIDASTEVEDTGVLGVGRWSFGNWYYRQYGKTEGMVDLVKALQRSNDIYFYKVGQWVGINKLADWSNKFGYGTKTGVDLPGEESGLVPDPEWKQQVKSEDWYLGDSFITAIGQGNLLATPLQVNSMTAVVANDGELCTPRVKHGEQECREIDINKNNLNLVKQGMEAACQEGGTAYPFFDFQPQVGCKTGTAESSGEDSLPHAWFTVYGPVDNPELVATVLLENAGEGSEQAAPIAKKILEYWFEKNN